MPITGIWGKDGLQYNDIRASTDDTVNIQLILLLFFYMLFFSISHVSIPNDQTRICQQGFAPQFGNVIYAFGRAPTESFVI